MDSWRWKSSGRKGAVGRTWSLNCFIILMRTCPSKPEVAGEGIRCTFSSMYSCDVNIRLPVSLYSLRLSIAISTRSNSHVSSRNASRMVSSFLGTAPSCPAHLRLLPFPERYLSAMFVDSWVCIHQSSASADRRLSLAVHDVVLHDMQKSLKYSLWAIVCPIRFLNSLKSITSGGIYVYDDMGFVNARGRKFDNDFSDMIEPVFSLEPSFRMGCAVVRSS